MSQDLLVLLVWVGFALAVPAAFRAVWLYLEREQEPWVAPCSRFDQPAPWTWTK